MYRKWDFIFLHPHLKKISRDGEDDLLGEMFTAHVQGPELGFPSTHKIKAGCGDTCNPSIQDAETGGF